ncbi:MAG: hypothetical protein ACI87W_001714 [Halieaceae bacterium]
MKRLLFFLFLTGCIVTALLLSARPLFWRYLQSTPDAWATLPGEALRDPLPPIRPGVTVGIEEVATLTTWRDTPLHMNRAYPYPGRDDTLLVNDMAGNNTDMKRILQRTRVDMRLALDAHGEILLLNKYDNRLRRLVRRPH